MTSLRKVLIVNTADRGGGAEQVAATLLDGFESLGTETWLAVGAKRSQDPRVLPVYQHPRVDYSRPRRRAAARAVELGRAVDRRLGREDLAHWSTAALLTLAGSPPDLVLCVNLHGGYFDLRELACLSRRVPVVLRLADSWLFTGHCAVPPGCGRWEHGCGSCPDLATPPAVRRDLTAYNWRRKRRLLAGARVHVTTPSRWLMDRARRSLLAPAIVGSRVVPNPIDTAVFAPGSRDAARAELGLDPGAAVLAFVSNLGATNPHKDFATLRRAVSRLTGAPEPGRALELLVVGAEAPEERPAPGLRVRHLPYERSRRRMAAVYRAADVYVHAARDESFCLTAAEALACGTPVVASASGGLTEVVDHARTGLVVAPGDDARLARGVDELLGDPARRERMGRLGGATVRRRYGGDRPVGELHAWCEEIAARGAAPAPHARVPQAVAAPA